MRKFRLLIGVVLLFLLSMLCLTSCGSQIDAPKNLKIDTDTQILTWDKNRDASGYIVLIGEKEKMTRGTSFDLSTLDPGVYDVKVKALGSGKDSKDSEYVSIPFKKDPETGLIYKLINDNTEYELVGVGSASGEVIMETTYRDKPVTSIAPAALANNTKITSFVINSNITSIPKKAFYNCSTLESVFIPESVTYIGENAFQSCRALTSVNIPSGVKVIEPYSFSYCRSMTEVTGADGVTSIGNFAFSECSALKSFTVPAGVTDIGSYAFSGCKELASVTLNPELVNIGEYAFYTCALVPEFKFGEKLETIGRSAFESCKGITAVDLPETLVSIGPNAFAACSALESVTGGENIRSIGTDILTGTSYYENYDGDIVYLGGWILSCKNPDIFKNQDLVIESGIIGIADYAFVNCDGFTGATLPDIIYIGDYAFGGCANLMDLKLGDNAETIGEGAFYGCSLLRNVWINNTVVKSIGEQAFYACTRLTSMDLPDTVEFIGSQAFYRAGIPAAIDGVIYVDKWVVGAKSEYISGITIKDGTVGIAEYAFFNCQLIGMVSIPNSVERICKGGFAMCYNLFIDDLPSKLRFIGDYAFYGCENSAYGYENNLDFVLPNSLESIGRSAFYANKIYGLEIPGSCKYIGDYAFFGCVALGSTEVIEEVDEETGEITQTFIEHSVTLEEGVEHIGSRAFYGCGLIEIKVPDSVKEMGIRTFYQCKSLVKVELGSGASVIPEYAFYECESLTDIIIPESFTTIGRSAFYNCISLSNVKIGYKLDEIGEYAFRGCEALTHFTTPTQTTTIKGHALRNLLNVTSIIVTDGVTDIGQHAFYNSLNATIYCESAEPMSGWHERWNSSYRPVIWGCTLSTDKSYVVSFVKDEGTVGNFDAINGISAPVREGYTFAGWATSDGGTPEYSAENIMDAPDGTTLYAVWQSSEVLG